MVSIKESKLRKMILKIVLSPLYPVPACLVSSPLSTSSAQTQDKNVFLFAASF